jgi:hypothetical protein
VARRQDPVAQRGAGCARSSGKPHARERPMTFKLTGSGVLTSPRLTAS